MSIGHYDPAVVGVYAGDPAGLTDQDMGKAALGFHHGLHLERPLQTVAVTDRQSAAHMGGMEQPEDAAKYLCGQENVYFDTAFASRFLTPEQFTKLVRLHGPERVLFATDCPWSTVPGEIALLEAAELTEEERENIAWKNAARLFHLDI